MGVHLQRGLMTGRLVYAMAVLVLLYTPACANYGLRDKLENPGGGGSGAFTSCGATCRIFVSQMTVQGNFGGPAQADAICMSDANRPPGNRLWKAMVVGSTRKACGTSNCGGGATEHVDWVMRPSTQYVRVDGSTLIGVTIPSAGIWAFELANSPSALGASPWTGLRTDWVMESGAVCHESAPFTPWVRNQSAQAGTVGKSDSVETEAISFVSTQPCDSFQPLYCVEQ